MGTADGNNSDSALNLVIDQSGPAPEDWDELLASDPCSDYFHTRHWLESAAKYHPDRQLFWLTARAEGRLAGGLACILRTKPVARWESSIEGTSGGPLLSADFNSAHRREVFNQLMEEYVTLRGRDLGTVCLSLNHAQQLQCSDWLVGTSIQWQYEETPAAVIPLEQGLDFVEMQLMKKNKRNERNRALRRNAHVKITNDPDLLSAYYPIYENASRVWGIEPSPLAFLQALLADPATDSHGNRRTFFTCVMVEDKVIGGHLNLHWQDRVIAWNGVTDPEYARTHFPATLAVWGDIEESCRRQARVLDLGGSGGVVSLQGFKKHFGAQGEMRGHYSHDSMGMKILRKGRNLLQGLRPGQNHDSAERWHDGSDSNNPNEKNKP
ncbi:MAG: GNAT family N-acetyltransferase [bacterium]|nr:GNAT family N-acetyltransferase [bacterium]